MLTNRLCIPLLYRPDLRIFCRIKYTIHLSTRSNIPLQNLFTNWRTHTRYCFTSSIESFESTCKIYSFLRIKVNKKIQITNTYNIINSIWYILRFTTYHTSEFLNKSQTLPVHWILSKDGDVSFLENTAFNRNYSKCLQIAAPHEADFFESMKIYDALHATLKLETKTSILLPKC